jgi:hypothetical protein
MKYLVILIAVCGRIGMVILGIVAMLLSVIAVIIKPEDEMTQDIHF